MKKGPYTCFECGAPESPSHKWLGDCVAHLRAERDAAVRRAEAWKKAAIDLDAWWSGASRKVGMKSLKAARALDQGEKP